MKKVEIYVLAGFLGSGKSTLLKTLLTNEKEAGRKVAVLMNELGEYSVDTGIVGGDVALRELLNGCICCTMKDEVEIQLLMLYQQEQPDVIYIEATGVAHPMEIYDACLSPVIAPYVEVKNMIGVVDSVRWHHRKSLNKQLQNLLSEQVRFSDTIVLNKSDLVTGEQQLAILDEIRLLNPRALCLPATYAAVAPDRLKGDREQPSFERMELHVHDHLHIQSMTYSFQQEIRKDSFLRWLESIPKTIYRVKGFVKFKGDERTWLVQYAYGMPHLAPQLISFPLNLVVIGDRLDKDGITQQLTKVAESCAVAESGR